MELIMCIVKITGTLSHFISIITRVEPIYVTSASPVIPDLHKEGVIN